LFVGVINYIGWADGSISPVNHWFHSNIIWYCDETNTHWFPESRSGICIEVLRRPL